VRNLTAGFAYEMRKFRQDNTFHRQRNGGARTWHREQNRSVHQAARRAAEHRGRSNLFVTKHSEQLAVARKWLAKQTGDGFECHVTVGNTCSAGHHHGIDLVMVTQRFEQRSHDSRVVGNYLPLFDSMSGRF
jgi:hypothetical protein